MMNGDNDNRPMLIPISGAAALNSSLHNSSHHRRNETAGTTGFSGKSWSSTDDHLNPEDVDSLIGSEDGEGHNRTRMVLSTKEAHLVLYSKFLVMLVLLVATAVAAILTYRYTLKEELDDFVTRVSASFFFSRSCEF